MSLNDIDSYIEQCGHLPRTSSASQIESDGGFELKSVALNHQEKIEEIFLHLIDLEHKLDGIDSKLIKEECQN